MGINHNFFMMLISESVVETMLSLWQFFGFFINDIFSFILTVNQTREVTGVTLFTSLLSVSMMAVLVTKQMIGTYALETEGDAERDPLNVLYRIGKALAVVGCNGWIFNELMDFTIKLGRDLNRVIGSNTDVSNVMLYLFSTGLESGPAYIFCGAALVIGLVLFLIEAGRRGAELTMSRMLFPLFALDILNTNPEKWNMFFFQYIINMLGYNIQLVCFRLMIIFLAQMDISDAETFAKNFIIAIGWLTMATKAPQWMEKYVYVSGTGRAVSSGASRLSQVIMYTRMAGR